MSSIKEKLTGYDGWTHRQITHNCMLVGKAKVIFKQNMDSFNEEAELNCVKGGHSVSRVQGGKGIPHGGTV